MTSNPIAVATVFLTLSGVSIADAYVCVDSNNKKVISTEPCIGATKVIPSQSAQSQLSQRENAARAQADLERQRNYFIGAPARQRMAEQQAKQIRDRESDADHQAALDAARHQQSMREMRRLRQDQEDARVDQERQNRMQAQENARTQELLERKRSSSVYPQDKDYNCSSMGGGFVRCRER